MYREPVLIVAPGGDPREWRFVKYVLEYLDRQRRVYPRDGEPVRHFASSLAIYRIGCRCDLIDPDETELLMIMSDTLALNVDKFVKIVNSFGSSIPRVKLTRIVRSYVEDIFFGRLYDSPEGRRELQKALAGLVIAPGLMTSKRGDKLLIITHEDVVDTFTAIVADKIYKKLVDILEKTQSGKVLLDITHGVNYMVAFTYRAVDISAALAVLDHYLTRGREKSVTIYVFNSDPFRRTTPPEARCKPEGREEEISLKINLVEQKSISVRNAVEILLREVMKLLSACKEVEKFVKRLLDKHGLERQPYGTALEALTRALLALAHGLAHYALTIVYSEREYIEQFLRKTEELLRYSSVKLKIERKDKNIIRLVYETPCLVPLMILVRFGDILLRAARTSIQEVKTDGADLLCVNVDLLRKLVECVPNAALRYIVDHELDEVIEYLDKVAERNRKCKKFTSIHPKAKKPFPEQRNFYAHVGLSPTWICRDQYVAICYDKAELEEIGHKYIDPLAATWH